MFAYKSIECLHQLLKSRHLFVVLFHYTLIWYFKLGNLESWGKKEKRKAILLLAHIADVSCLANRPFYYANIVFKFYFYAVSYEHKENFENLLCKKFKNLLFTE